MKDMITNRLKKLRTCMVAKGLDAIIASKPENRRYLSGFTGTSGFVLILKDKSVFITDFRYVGQATEQCLNFNIEMVNQERGLHTIIGEQGISRLGFEDDFMTYSDYAVFGSELPNVEMVPLEGLLTDLRAVKDEFEIEQIRKAASIADKAFEHILSYVKPGVTELSVGLELEFYMKKLGASGLSFSSIVASGVRSALPHGVASDKIIEDGDFLTLDFGCIYNGYCSDMTRTLVVGKASEKQKEIYNIVLEAQEKALEHIKSGVKGMACDTVARDIIKSYGYGEYFGHGLGHGVGLEIHENPYLSFRFPDHVLELNSVVTNEPGIYIPEFGGVRIEDLVVVREDGPEVLSKSPKHLIEL